MHPILTYKMEFGRLGCMNRDKNGCKNIQKLFKCFIESKDIPECYRRKPLQVLPTPNSEKH